MAEIEKLYLNGIDENGNNVLMDGLGFVRAVNANGKLLKTNTTLDLDTHNTPEHIAKALNEQAKMGKDVINFKTPGGPDDLPTFSETGAPVNSPSELCDNIAQVYNTNVDEKLNDSPEEGGQLGPSGGVNQGGSEPKEPEEEGPTSGSKPGPSGSQETEAGDNPGESADKEPGEEEDNTQPNGSEEIAAQSDEASAQPSGIKKLMNNLMNKNEE